MKIIKFTTTYIYICFLNLLCKDRDPSFPYIFDFIMSQSCWQLKILHKRRIKTIEIYHYK